MHLLSKSDYILFQKICSVSEDSLLHIMSKYLRKKYKEVYATADYVYAIGEKEPIMLVAHMDTVFPRSPKDFYYDKEKNVIWSPEGGIGDDRAGVFAIIKILDDGYRPSVLFTTREESGGGGAKIFSSIHKEPKTPLKYIIELDRRGKDDCVFYNCDNEDFTEYVSSFGFIEDWGSFSDISIICPDWEIAGVNLSIGYENEHSYSELLKVSPLLATIKKVKQMLKDSDDAPFFKYIEAESFFSSFTSINNNPYYFDDEDNDDYYNYLYTGPKDVECHFCGKIEDEIDAIPFISRYGNVLYCCTDCLASKDFGWCPECNNAFERNDYNTDCPKCKMKPKGEKKNDEGRDKSINK